MGLTSLTTFALSNCQTALVALVVSAATVSVWPLTVDANDFPVEQLEYFEKYIRPVLVQRCHSCHHSNKQEGGLQLDSRQNAIQGGDRGQAMIPGNPNGSLLIKALTYEDDELAMPPDGKLPPLEIEHLVKWVAMGAPWPAPSEPAPSESARTFDNGKLRRLTDSSSTDYEQHWAFQAVQQVELPEFEAPDWPLNAIDAFVLQRLESAHLAPAEEAEPRTMVRRLYLDLIGLPPSFEDVEQFIRTVAADQTSVDYSALIEDLLSRREYGERWARHWLDVARYADTKGYVDGGQREFAFAYTYRDYVIRAFNEDLPFDQFIVDQLAADQITYSSAERWRMAAMGFLTVGRRFNHNPYDILDDQIDAISRGLQAMTVSCARCHDHKYDPIPTADYYSLYGILASSYEPLQPELPIMSSQPVSDEYAEYARELTKRAVAFDEQFNQLHRQIERELREMATDYLVYIVKESSRHRGSGQNPLRTERVFLRGPSAYAAGAIRRWRNYVYSRDTNDQVFGLWHRMDPFVHDEFAEQLRRQLDSTNIHPLVKAALILRKPTSMVELAQCYGQVLEQTAQTWEQHLEKFPSAERFEDPELESIRQVLFGTGSPAVMSAQESIDCYHLDDSTGIRNKAGEIEKLTLEYKGELPDRAMILREGDLYQPTVFLRGEHTRPGPAVPRKLPQVFLGNSASEPFHDRSGRLELARQIASPDNRLTARVIVNRVWGWHFGQPLVSTPSDFGLRSESPTHPELLDYLANWFIDNGWSLKRLHRLIVSSRTYRQSNATQALSMTSDPENRLLWRFAPRRLEWEAIRDCLFAASDQLAMRNGGRPVSLDPAAIEGNCRTIYLTVDRQNIQNFARDFDFPAPDMSVPQRIQTIVPQQQLFFLNSPLVMEHARAAARVATQSSSDNRTTIGALFRQILGRDPTSQEFEVSENYVRSVSKEPWTALAHGLLQSNEFITIP